MKTVHRIKFAKTTITLDLDPWGDSATIDGRKVTWRLGQTAAWWIFEELEKAGEDEAAREWSRLYEIAQKSKPKRVNSDPYSKADRHA